MKKASRRTIQNTNWGQGEMGKKVKNKTKNFSAKTRYGIVVEGEGQSQAV